MIILCVDWWEGKTVSREGERANHECVIPWMCYLNEWFPRIAGSLSGCEQGKKVRKGFGRWLRVCCLSRDRGTTWTRSRHHTFLSPHPMPPHFTVQVNLEKSPNVPSNPLKAWQRSGEIRHRMSPYITYVRWEFQSWGAWLSWWKIK